jgi:hypothetical protein
MARHNTIGSLAEVRAGYQHRLAEELSESGAFLLIQQKDILSNRSGVDYDQAARISPQRSHAKQVLREGDVVFMNKGHAPFACAVRELPEPAIASSVFFILRPDTVRILPEYLAWVLNRRQTRHEMLRAAGSGSAMPVIHRKALEGQGIPLPPMETQCAIAALVRLVAEEKEILLQLAEQKGLLVDGVCEKLISGTTGL